MLRSWSCRSEWCDLVKVTFLTTRAWHPDTCPSAHSDATCEPKSLKVAVRRREEHRVPVHIQADSSNTYLRVFLLLSYSKPGRAAVYDQECIALRSNVPFLSLGLHKDWGFLFPFSPSPSLITCSGRTVLEQPRRGLHAAELR